MAKNDWFNKFSKDDGKSNSDKLKAELLKALPAIRQFRAQGGEMQIAFMAPAAWTMLGTPDPLMLNDISSKITTVPKSELNKLFKDFAERTDYSKALESVESTRKHINGLPESGRIGFEKFLRDIVPLRLLKILAMIGDMDLSKTPEQGIREENALYAAKSDDELAKARMEHAALVPFKELEDALHETLQKASPQAIEAFLGNLTRNFTGDEITDLILTGIKTVEEAGIAAEQGRDIDFNELSVGSDFQASLKKLLATVDNSLIVAGLVPDTDVHAAFEENKRRRDNSNNAGPLFKPGKPNGPKL